MRNKSGSTSKQWYDQVLDQNERLLGLEVWKANKEGHINIFKGERICLAPRSLKDEYNNQIFDEQGQLQVNWERVCGLKFPNTNQLRKHVQSQHQNKEDVFKNWILADETGGRARKEEQETFFNKVKAGHFHAKNRREKERQEAKKKRGIEEEEGAGEKEEGAGEKM